MDGPSTGAERRAQGTESKACRCGATGRTHQAGGTLAAVDIAAATAAARVVGTRVHC